MFRNWSLILKMWWCFHPSIIRASRVVSPFSSGFPPKPTVPRHCICSHSVQLSSTASKALRFSVWRTSQAIKNIIFPINCMYLYIYTGFLNVSKIVVEYFYILTSFIHYKRSFFYFNFIFEEINNNIRIIYSLWRRLFYLFEWRLDNSM